MIYCPMTSTMVQALTAALIKRGLKAGTILSYMSTKRQADTMVKAAIKGLKNKESLNEAPRAVTQDVCGSGVGVRSPPRDHAVG